MTQYDNRQLALMQAQIERFCAGEQELGTLVANLEALSVALEQPGADFSETFHEHWFDLEQVLAAALDGSYEDVLADNRALVEQAVGALASLVNRQLQGSATRDGAPQT
jgi:hypothetical protein